MIREGRDFAEPSTSVSRNDFEFDGALSCSIGVEMGAESVLRFRASTSSVEGGEAGFLVALATGCGGDRSSTSIPVGGGRAGVTAEGSFQRQFCQKRGGKGGGKKKDEKELCVCQR